jgi:AcrR family transcriptional regulator
MSDKVFDRRIQKTLQHLQTALVELIDEKEYDAITIKDILDRANVGRSTFYAHFENKDQLLRSVLVMLNERFDEGITQLSERHGNYENNSAHMPLKILRFVEQNHRLFRAMLGKSGQDMHHNPLDDYLFTVTREHFRLMLQIKRKDRLHVDMPAHSLAHLSGGWNTKWFTQRKCSRK